jgi:Tfp pilus assembly protein PilN
MQSINLIPQQEVQDQVQEKAVKLSTWLSIGLLIIIGAVSGFYLYRTFTLKDQLKVVDSEINSLRGQIASMAQVEVNARNLDKKFNMLKEIFAGRTLYSLLVTEVKARTPGGVVVDSMTLQKGSVINLTGHADNYILISLFTNNLISTEFSGGDPLLKPLFTSVTLNSVSLEKNQNLVTFSINVELDLRLLTKK